MIKIRISKISYEKKTYFSKILDDFTLILIRIIISFFQEVIVMTENKQFTTASSNFSHHSGSSYSQPYRFGGRVGLFGHYLRSLKIILLLTCIKLDATTKNGSRNPNSSNQQSQHKVVDHILKGICDLASSIEAVERKYVKKGQRLLFCGPDLISLGSRCIDLQRAFDALQDTVQGKQTVLNN